MRSSWMWTVLAFQLSVPALAAAETQDRHVVRGNEARQEFFALKEKKSNADRPVSLSFQWLPEFNFVFIESVTDRQRVCYFGVRERRGKHENVPTSFLCADYVAPQQSDSRCQPRPSGSACLDPYPSIGIGNLRTTPTTSIASFSEPDEYPKELDLSFEYEWRGGVGNEGLDTM